MSRDLLGGNGIYGRLSVDAPLVQSRDGQDVRGTTTSIAW